MSQKEHNNYKAYANGMANGEKCFRCKRCPESLLRRSNLKYHKKTYYENIFWKIIVIKVNLTREKRKNLSGKKQRKRLRIQKAVEKIQEQEVKKKTQLQKCEERKKIREVQ